MNSLAVPNRFVYFREVPLLSSLLEEQKSSSSEGNSLPITKTRSSGATLPRPVRETAAELPPVRRKQKQKQNQLTCDFLNRLKRGKIPLKIKMEERQLR